MFYNPGKLALLFSMGIITSPAWASDFYRLDEAYPKEVNITSFTPVFDFDDDGCFPSAGISRTGEQNGGLKPTGSLGGACRSGNFMDLSNTYHRYTCQISGNQSYCAHFFALYFEKDQLLAGVESGHRHDWEHVVVWTIDGKASHVSYSAHGELFTSSASEVPFEAGHPKLVYHKEGVGSHALRFAKSGEQAENPYGIFITPKLVSWFEFEGDGLTNDEIRRLIHGFDYGSALFPLADWKFWGDISNYTPDGYPNL